MKTNLLAVAVAVTSLCSSVAFADDWTQGCDHDARAVQPAGHARPAPRGGGEYQLQTTQVWVAGRYEQVATEPVCHFTGWGQLRSRVCVGGGLVSRWVPGGYQAQQNWVWVAAPAHQQVYGRHVSHGRYYRGHHRD